MAAYQIKTYKPTGKRYAMPQSVIDAGEQAMEDFVAQNPSIDEAKAQSESYKSGAPKEDRTRTEYMGTGKGLDIGDAVEVAAPLGTWLQKRDYPSAVVTLGTGVDMATNIAPQVLAAKGGVIALNAIRPWLTKAPEAISTIAELGAKPLTEGAIGAAMYAPQELLTTGEVGGGTAIIGATPVGIGAIGMGLRQLGKGGKVVANYAAEQTAKGLDAANLPTAAAVTRAATERVQGIATPSQKVAEALQAELAPVAEERIRAGKVIGLTEKELPMKSLFGEGPVAQRETASLADQSQAAWDMQTKRERQFQKGAITGIKDLAGGKLVDATTAGNTVRDGVKNGINRLIGDLDVSHNKIVKENPDLMISPEGQDALAEALLDVNDLSDIAKKADVGAGEAKELERLSMLAIESNNYRDLNRLRQFVGKQISAGKGIKDSEYLKSLGKMYAGINDALFASLPPEMAEQLAENNKVISSVLRDGELFSSVLNRDVGGEKVLAAATNDSRKVQALRTLLTPEEFDTAFGGYLDSKLNFVKDGNINAAGARQFFENFSEQVRPFVAGKESQYSTLREVLNLGEDIQSVRARSGAERTPTGLSDIAQGVKSIAELATRDAPLKAAESNALSQIALKAIADIDQQLAQETAEENIKLLKQRRAQFVKQVMNRAGGSAVYRPAVSIGKMYRASENYNGER